jgi:hypothetical protein
MRQLGDYIIQALFNAVLQSKNQFHGDMYTLAFNADLFSYFDEGPAGDLKREDDDIFLLIKDNITITYYAQTDSDNGVEVRICIDFNGFVTGIDYTELSTYEVKTIEVEK